MADRASVEPRPTGAALGGTRLSAGRALLRGLGRRVVRDVVAVQAIGIGLAIVIVVAVGPNPAVVPVAAVLGVVLVQVALAAAGGAAQGARPLLGRLLLNVALVAVGQAATQWVGLLAVAYLPVVAVAASRSGRAALGVTLAAVAGDALIETSAGTEPLVVGGRVAAFAILAGLAAATMALEVGRLRSVRARLRGAVTGERRRGRQIRAVEAIGHILASDGPSPSALDAVVARIAAELSYEYVALYVGDREEVRLGAQRGYADLVESFDGSRGVVGRVMRTSTPAFVPEVTRDPDYWSINPEVRSEICVPLLAGDEFLGFLNVESIGDPLDVNDLRTLVAVADRLAAAFIIGRERQRLAERVELLRRLHDFGESITGTLEAEGLCTAIVAGAGSVVQADVAALVVLDQASGRYLLRAIEGADHVPVGVEVRPGEGMAGRAIRDRALVVDTEFGRDAVPASVSDLAPAAAEPMAAVSAPLIRDHVVIGAITLLRRDRERPFGELDLDALSMLAGQSALAVANAFLHAEVADLAIRDPLTGLFNRRYLESALTQLFAQRDRVPDGERPALSLIMFDLDHFSSLNNEHGHQAGDAVLREFGDVLRGRFRATDVVARLGGEEFVAVVYRADLAAALAIADEVRAAFAERVINGPGATRLRATVSAGCATVGPESDAPDTLLRAADVALYMAKRAGRDRVMAA